MESRGWKQGRKGGENQVEWNENPTKSNSWKHLFWSNEFSSPVSFPRLSVSLFFFLSFSLIKQILVVECVTGESKEIRGERDEIRHQIFFFFFFFWNPFLSLSSTLIPPSLNGSYPLFWRAYNSPLAWYVLRNGCVKLLVSICIYLPLVIGIWWWGGLHTCLLLLLSLLLLLVVRFLGFFWFPGQKKLK